MSDPVETSNSSNARKPGGLKGLWRALHRPSVRYSLVTLVGAGFVVGIIFLSGFHTGLGATNTEAFCITATR